MIAVNEYYVLNFETDMFPLNGMTTTFSTSSFSYSLHVYQWMNYEYNVLNFETFV